MAAYTFSTMATAFASIQTPINGNPGAERQTEKSAVTALQCLDKWSKWPLTLNDIPDYLIEKAGTTTTQLSYLKCLYIIHSLLQKTQDKDKYMPRQERVDLIKTELQAPSQTKAPESYCGKNRDATWHYEVKNNFFYNPTPCHDDTLDMDLFEGVYKWSKADQRTFLAWKAGASSKPMPQPAMYTAAEDSYNIIVDSHVDLNLAHHGRDETYKRVRLVSSSITKEVVADFCAACPGCRVRRQRAVGAHWQHRPDAPIIRQRVIQSRAQTKANSAIAQTSNSLNQSFNPLPYNQPPIVGYQPQLYQPAQPQFFIPQPHTPTAGYQPQTLTNQSYNQNQTGKPQPRIPQSLNPQPNNQAPQVPRPVPGTVDMRDWPKLDLSLTEHRDFFEDELTTVDLYQLMYETWDNT